MFDKSLQKIINHDGFTYTFIIGNRIYFNSNDIFIYLGDKYSDVIKKLQTEMEFPIIDYYKTNQVIDLKNIWFYDMYCENFRLIFDPETSELVYISYTPIIDNDHVASYDSNTQKIIHNKNDDNEYNCMAYVIHTSALSDMTIDKISIDNESIYHINDLYILVSGHSNNNENKLYNCTGLIFSIK